MSTWRTLFFVAAVAGIAATALYAFGPPDLRWKIVSALPEALRGPKAYVLLEIDQTTLQREALDSATSKLRDALNAATPIIPFRELEARADFVHAQIVDPIDAPRALATAQAALSDEYAVSLQPGGWIVARLADASINALLTRATQHTADIVQRRLEPLGALVRVSSRDNGRFLVQAMRLPDRNAFAAIVSQRGRLTIAPQPRDQGDALMFAPPPAPLRVIQAGAYRGDDGEATLSVDVDQQSERSLCRITRDNIGERLAVALDSQALATLPIETEICGGPLLLSAQPSLDAANAVAHILGAGALPAPLRVLAQGVGDPPS